MKKVKRIVLWFRQDLRLHDNEALTAALERAEEVIPIYVFDERHTLGTTPLGFRKMGKFRARFLIESVQDLRNQLRQRGIDLVVRHGKPEEEVFALAQQVQSSWVFANMERTHEEVQVQNSLEQQLWTIGQELHFFRGKMLYYTQDLPFPIQQTPNAFAVFRKEVERIVPIREPLPTPAHFSPWTVAIESGSIPTLTDFGHEEFTPDPRAALLFKGGETEGMKRVQYYFWESNRVISYEETHKGFIGGDYSTKFSPWLALGCLSPKYIYAELKRYEAERIENKSTYTVFFELLWRDFCRLMGKKHGTKIFRKGGIAGSGITVIQQTNDPKRFKAWIEGTTGWRFTDANMVELRETGFLSSQGRQIVSSVLIHDLHVNWQWGAEYFESQLIDYDVCSNWVNWIYMACLAKDPREERYFPPRTQSKRYDPKGEYVNLWLPHLKNVPDTSDEGDDWSWVVDDIEV